jgi:Transposase DDE domain
VRLISGTNSEGYWHALIATFSVTSAPAKGSLSKIRKKISYLFFKDIFEKLLSDFEDSRFTYQGLKIYAVDGLELHLPRTTDLKKHGYRGRAVMQYLDTYGLRMYLCHAYDVLSGVTKDLRFSPWNDEIAHAKNMVKHFGKDSLALYDRLYISTKMILAHHHAGNYFLMRAKRKSFKEIEAYYQSHSQKTLTVIIRGVSVRLFKSINPHTGKKDVFVTNLPWRWLSAELIQRLYLRRWEVETSFADVVNTMKLEQWHSTSLNGILQEIFATFWTMNFTRIQIAKKSKKPKITMSDQYEKPNFKLIVDWMKTKLKRLLNRSLGVLRELKKLIKLSTEKRVHYERSYPRQLKCAATPYSYNNTIWRWEH